MHGRENKTGSNKKKATSSSSSSSSSKKISSSSNIDYSNGTKNKKNEKNANNNKENDNFDDSGNEEEENQEEENQEDLDANEAIFSNSIELLLERKSSTKEREGALVALNNILSHNFCSDCVLSNVFRLEDGIKKSLAKSSTEIEKTQAIRTTLLFALNAGFSETLSLFRSLSPIFIEFVSNSDSDSVKASGIDGFSGLSFLCQTGDHTETNESLKMLENLLKEKLKGKANRETNKQLLRSVLLGWGLLATTLPDSFILSNIYDRTFDLFISALDHDDLEIKRAAGENIALLLEINRDNDESFCVHDGGFDDLLEKLADFTGETSRARATKEKKKTKEAFKDIRFSIHDGIDPEENLMFNGQSVIFEGWKQIKQLTFFRDILAVGFHQHFLENAMLHKIFNAKINKNLNVPNLSSLEKRHLKSPNSGVAKERTKQLKKQRKQKNVALSFEQDANDF